ncbi:MAG: serine/threonine-protein kinase [Kofleriaceae bacterium]
MARNPMGPDGGSATTTMAVGGATPMPTADTLRDPRTASVAAQPGPVVFDSARYALREVIGRGGMGEVWVAEDRDIGREVAVKVARAEVDAEGLARFLREARIQGQLDHPAVVPVHDVSAEAGNAYFTMKRVRGETLAALCSKLAAGDVEAARRANPRRLLTAFVSACHAVELAHARGILHRDLKPANIMLGDHGEVYVLDWGLAKVGDVIEAPSTAPSLPPGLDGALTEAGQYLGTPGYMAPEQARGALVDERSDVYALGATLFELLTHRPLIPRGPVPAVIAATLAGVDARASLRAATPVAPELEEVCIRATASHPDDRYRSVAQMREAIERFLDGDRDLERRRTLAAQATDAARAVHAAAVAGEPGARATALGELGQALVLDPSHADAQALLMELLVAPPPATPPEVERAVAAAEDATYATLAGAGAWIFVLWLPLALILAWMGIRNVDPLLGWVGFTVATAMAMLTAKARGRMDPLTYFGGLVLSSAAIAIASRVFGTMILTPTLMTMNTVGFAAAARRRWLWPTLAVSLAFLVGPPALEALGWIGRTTVVADGAIQVTSGVVTFREPQATVVTVGAAALFLIMVTVAVSRIRTRMFAQTRKAELAAWQLRQLVPRIER